MKLSEVVGLCKECLEYIYPQDEISGDDVGDGIYECPSCGHPQLVTEMFYGGYNQ